MLSQQPATLVLTIILFFGVDERIKRRVILKKMIVYVTVQ